MDLTDLELMQHYAEDESPQERLQRQRMLEQWIVAGVLTPKETHEAARVLRLLRERARGTERAA